jgi:hypothetical protein
VKKVVLTPCKLVCTKVFTLWRRIFRQDAQIPEPKTKSSGGKTTKTGGSDPTFRAFSRPKSFLGSLPPCGTSSGADRFPTAARDGVATQFQGGNYAYR